MTPFLTARWLDLALVTWEIPAEMLRPHLPPGLEPDTRPGDPAGIAYVSFVAFRFLGTKVKGIAVPLHTDFPEVNLRAYVRQTENNSEGQRRRGVVFIAELVPSPAIAVIANLLYHEHYRAVPMDCTVEDIDDVRRMRMTIELGERTHAMTITGDRETVMPSADSAEHFFKEHEWGFGRDADGGLVVYRVEHPEWRVYPTSLDRLELDVDFAELYGEPWGVLDGKVPAHLAFAVGSEIAVHGREQ